MTESQIAARAEGASKVYNPGANEVRALDNVTIGFEKSKFTSIMGPSGSGKSTLMQCVAGLDRLTSGQVYVGDQELGKLDATQLTLLRRDRIGFIFQAFNLIPTLTAEENILLPLTLAKRKVDPAFLEKILDTVGLQQRRDHKPTQLSGGQQQRVAVARALVGKPDIVFADEPTGNLDSHSSTEILNFMRQAVDEFGQTIVMVTHDPRAAAHSHRVLFLADGKIVDQMESPTSDGVLDRMKQFGA